jgi:undecaprenyl-diphosphatase
MTSYKYKSGTLNSHEKFFLFILLILTLLFFGLTYAVLSGMTLSLDLFLSAQVYAKRTPTLTDFFNNITYLGDQALIVGVIVCGGIFVLRREYKKAFVVTFLPIVGATVGTILKLIINRPRPTIDPLQILQQSSFPSIHSLNSFLFYSLIGYFLIQILTRRWQKITVILLSQMVAVLIAFSRIYLGVHYPSDTLSGALIGYICLIGGLLLLMPRVKIKN